MSWLPQAASGSEGRVSVVVEPSSKDLGGFRVRRALPSIQRRMVGPFVFLDHMGPVIWQPGQGLDVRPHPHIGLATLTYLTDGEIFHRDSLGTALAIRPGEVNWMTAGRGIAHSERTEAGLRETGHELQGIQSWLALPKVHEETAPGFVHHAAGDMPSITDRGVSLRLVVGSLFGQTSPVATFSETFYADVTLATGASLPLPPDHPERAAYVLSGALEVAGEVFHEHQLLVFNPGDDITIRATQDSRVLLLGGEPLDGPRHLWWNFVSSSQDRIEAAKADWKAGRFGLVPGDDEFIPLPG